MRIKEADIFTPYELLLRSRRDINTGLGKCNLECEIYYKLQTDFSISFLFLYLH